jgi:hypothetical protein
METDDTMFQFFFYACLTLLAVAAVLGIVVVWFEDAWDNEYVWKGIWTSIVLFATSVSAAAIVRWLG